MEKAWYEVSPYIYGLAGMLSLFWADSKVGYISAALLISAALTIFSLRQHYRKAERESFRNTNIDPVTRQRI
jgi:hypothetical protein